MVWQFLQETMQKDSLVGDTKKKIYDYLIEGATSGLTDDALYGFVTKQVPKANSRRIVRAGFMALSDPALTDRNILNVIYALAIKYRLADGPWEEGGDNSDSKIETVGAMSSKTDEKPARSKLPNKKRKS
jgi:hypothetical protein